jgi:hypothetical protein
MLEDFFNHLLILNKTDDLHPPLTFRAAQRVYFVARGTNESAILRQ